MAAQNSRSRAVSPTFRGVPPACMFERVSPSRGTRLMAPTASPSTRMIRLSPFSTAGRNFCAISGSRLMPVNSSQRALKLRSFGSSRKTPALPLP